MSALLKELQIQDENENAEQSPVEVNPYVQPAVTAESTSPSNVDYADPVYHQDEYVIRRKVFKIFGGSFHIYDKNGNLAFYSKQKAFKLKEDIRVYGDTGMTSELLLIKARGVIDLGMTYDVIDSTTGTAVGALKRKGLKSFLRDDPTGSRRRSGAWATSYSRYGAHKPPPPTNLHPYRQDNRATQRVARRSTARRPTTRRTTADGGPARPDGARVSKQVRARASDMLRVML